MAVQQLHVAGSSSMLALSNAFALQTAYAALLVSFADDWKDCICRQSLGAAAVSVKLPKLAHRLSICRMYATAAARQDGLLLLCGGRDAANVPLGDAYGLARHRDGRWEWAAAPGTPHNCPVYER